MTEVHGIKHNKCVTHAHMEHSAVKIHLQYQNKHITTTTKFIIAKQTKNTTQLKLLQ